MRQENPRLHPNREPAQILTPTPTAFWPIDGHRHRAVGRSARVAATPFSLRPHARRDTHTALTPMMMRAPEEYAKQKSRRPSPRSQSAIIAAAHIRRTRAVHARPAFCCLSRSLLARAGGLVLLDTVMSAQNLSVGRRSAPGSVLSELRQRRSLMSRSKQHCISARPRHQVAFDSYRYGRPDNPDSGHTSPPLFGFRIRLAARGRPEPDRTPEA